MNRPKALRLGLSSIAVLVAAVTAFGPGFASGDVSSTATAWYGPTGATTLSPVPGSANDYEIDQFFTYSDINEDLKKWIVDSPAGLVGNPNAVPESARCTMAQFDPSGTFGGPSEAVSQAYPSACPASSRVGFAKLYTESDGKDLTGATLSTGSGQQGPTGYVYPPAGTPLSVTDGTIFLLKTTPEVPTILATVLKINVFQPGVCASLGSAVTPCIAYRRTTSTLAPETNLSPDNNGDTDFRIRTIPNEFAAKPVAYGPTAYTPGVTFPPYTQGGLLSHVSRIDQHLFAYPNQDTSQPRFLTMPSRLDGWDSYSYSTAYNTNTLADLVLDPNNPSQLFKKSAAHTATPAQTKPDLKATATATLSSGARDSNPGLTVKVADPTAIGDDQVKKMVTTLPAAVSIDVDALNNVCTIAERNSDSCPAASQVGTATIATPLISAGLTGRVYMTTGLTKALPFLSIFVDGAVKFRLDASTRFVGADFNQIETTFNNLPQSPFTDFTVKINGGTSSSLLYNRACPTDGSAPPSGSTAFTIDGYSGNTSSSSSSNTFNGCYGVNKPGNLSHCVKQSKKLKVSPKGLIDAANIAKVDLLIGSKSTSLKKRSTVTKSPAKFSYTLKKSTYKTNKKYYYAYKVTYKPTPDNAAGQIVKTKSGTFKTCKKK
jgi:hypothetical protein